MTEKKNENEKINISRQCLFKHEIKLEEVFKKPPSPTLSIYRKQCFKDDSKPALLLILLIALHSP
jgi:hypothetical protein